MKLVAVILITAAGIVLLLYNSYRLPGCPTESLEAVTEAMQRGADDMLSFRIFTISGRVYFDDHLIFRPFFVFSFIIRSFIFQGLFLSQMCYAVL